MRDDNVSVWLDIPQVVISRTVLEAPGTSLGSCVWRSVDRERRAISEVESVVAFVEELHSGGFSCIGFEQRARFAEVAVSALHEIGIFGCGVIGELVLEYGDVH